MARGASGGLSTLLDSVRRSPDFRTAYEVLLATARQQLRSNPQAARQLLQALDQANPRRPDVRLLLREAFGP